MWFALLVSCVDVREGATRPAGFEVHGIDVSHHQGWIDWRRVAETGQVEFAFVKATEGVTHIDRRFD